MKAVMFLIVGLSSLVALAKPSTPDEIKKIKYQAEVVSPTVIKFELKNGHHFNDQAPSKVVVKSAGKNYQAKLQVTPLEITAQFDEQAVKGNCEISADLFVCDDANTYCVPKRQTHSCDGELAAATTPTASVRNQEAVAEATTYFENKELFILNKPDEALAIAKKEKKPLLIDFFGIWCPPCNMLDETVFSTQAFQKFKKDFVLLKLDADKPVSWELKSKFNVRGYPTVVFATSQGDEIGRVVGARRVKPFVAEMKRALKSKNTSIEQLQVMADSEGHPKQAYELGMIYLNREEFALANYYLLKASQKWTANDPKRNDLLSSQLGMQLQLTDPESKKVTAKLYEASLKWYPHRVEALDRAQKLVELATDLGDEKLVERGKELGIQAALWFTKNPSSLTNEEATLADIYSYLGENEKDMATSKEYYKKAYEEYTRLIKQARLDERVERGYNLERIYCLWKSGDAKDAQDLYSQLEKAYPNEFTFYYQHAHLLKDVKNYNGALEKALTAYKYSYGDNKLRVTGLLGELYKETGKPNEGLKIVDEVLKGFDLPEDKNIRTHLYVERLKKMREELKKGA